MKRRTSVGLDIGTAITKVVVVEHGKDGTFHILGTSKSETKGMRQGYPIDLPEVTKTVQEVILEAERKTGQKIKHLTMSIGGVSLESVTAPGGTIISRADNEITELDVEKSIAESLSTLNSANKKVLHEIAIEHRIDGDPVYGDPIGMKGLRLDIRTLFVTTLERHYNNLIKIVEAAGVSVDDVIATPLATSLTILNERQKNAGCILIDIGQEIVTISIFENGKLAAIKTFPVGSSHITNDIALGLQIPLEDAELLKTGHIIGSFPKKKLEEIIEARLEDIFELIGKYLKKIGRHKLLPAGAIIVGGGAGSHATEIVAKQILKIPVRIGQAKSILPHKTMRQDQTWFTALGLCIADRFNEKEYSGDNMISDFFKPIKDVFSELIKQLMP
ncbi:MAG: cell division protein FtsA [Candidatus Paceibacteria bacterium]|jgi:cell division protein FtsA